MDSKLAKFIPSPCIIFLEWNRDCSFSTVTSQRAGQQGIVVQFPACTRTFSHYKAPRPALESRHLPSQWVLWIPFLWVKLTVHEVHLSPPVPSRRRRESWYKLRGPGSLEGGSAVRKIGPALRKGVRQFGRGPGSPEVGPAVRKGARQFGRGPESEYVAHVFVLICSVIICRLYKPKSIFN